MTSNDGRVGAHGMSPTLAAAAWMGGAIVAFISMAVAGRELSSELHTFQIMAARNGICLAVLVVVATWVGWRQIRTQHLGTHLARNTLHFGAQFGWFYAVATIPLAEVFAIEFTTPIWTALLAAAFLGERLGARRIVGIALGFAGVVVILRPGLDAVHPAALAVLGAALGYAVTYVITKHQTVTESPLAILFYMNLVQLPLGLAPSLGLWVWPSAELWPWVGVVGIAGLASHYCISRAMGLADAGLVIPLDFLRLPLIALIGWLVYAEALDPFVFAGAALVLAGNLVNLRGDRAARTESGGSLGPRRPSGRD